MSVVLIFNRIYLDRLINVINSNENSWNKIIDGLLSKKNTDSAYIIYFKTSARGYASHDEVLSLDNPINIKKLKFHTKGFGLDKVKK